MNNFKFFAKRLQARAACSVELLGV